MSITYSLLALSCIDEFFISFLVVFQGMALSLGDKINMSQKKK